MTNSNLSLPYRLFLQAVAVIVLLCVFVFPTYAKNNVRATLVSEYSTIEEEKNIRLGVLLNAPDGWHTYHKNPGDAGLPTKLKWLLPDGFSAGEIDWPQPTKFAEGDLTTYGYTGETLLPVTITVPKKLSDKSYSFTVHAEWLSCNEICIPESQTLNIELPVGDVSPSPESSLFIQQKIPAPDVTPLSLTITLALALLGGLILNVMPCVLPVLSLKTFALVKKSGHARAHTAKYGIAYTVGILASFAVIASVLIALQQGGEAIGWGFQMQSPAFIGFLIYLLFLVGLNLSGLFHLPVMLGGVGNNLNENTLRGSFLTGILATLVATPCTAPFMASAVGAALTLPAWAAMLVFLSLGFGLALPFLLISIFPSLLRFLPKQGAWMERFKELLAFPMYASVIWLIWVLGKQTGADGVALILCGLLLITFIIWLQRMNAQCKLSHRIFTIFATTVMLAAIIFVLGKNESGESQSTPYSKAALAELRAEGKAVYVDATAAWCITCQLNKKIALDTKRTQQAFKDHNITFMVADWTRRNPEITEFLRGFGYNGVPLNVFYPAGGGEPIVLPQILSEETVIETIKNPAPR
jgi:thiol:disulfide interchange protein DsbD